MSESSEQKVTQAQSEQNEAHSAIINNIETNDNNSNTNNSNIIINCNNNSNIDNKSINSSNASSKHSFARLQFSSDPLPFQESTEKFMQIKTREILPLLNKVENRSCFDCESTPAYWVCLQNAIFLCGKCASEHRNYGSAISKIKFLCLDSLNEFQVELLKIGGNLRLNQLLLQFKINKKKQDNLLLFGSRLLDYYRDLLYNKLANKPAPNMIKTKEAMKLMENFKGNKRPDLEKVVIGEEKNEEKTDKFEGGKTKIEEKNDGKNIINEENNDENIDKNESKKEENNGGLKTIVKTNDKNDEGDEDLVGNILENDKN